jgi:hypothetical protein
MASLYTASSSGTTVLLQGPAGRPYYPDNRIVGSMLDAV